MTIAVINGDTPATGSVAFYSFITMLVTTGCQKVRDSDGTTYSASGTQITSGASGANGLANNSAWFIVRDPSNREYCFQRGTTNLLWRIVYSASAGFTGGSPGATRIPTATDQALLFGGGTDAAPTFNSFWTTDNTYRLYGFTDPTYGFWLGSILTAGGAASAGMYQDVITPASASDLDPTITHISVSGAFSRAAIGSVTASLTSNRTAGWLQYGAGGSCVGIGGSSICDDTGVVIYPNNAGPNPHDNKDQLRPIPYVRKTSHAAPYGDKGTSRIVAWPGTTRTSGETYSVSSDRDWFRLGDIALRWNGAVVVGV